MALLSFAPSASAFEIRTSSVSLLALDVGGQVFTRARGRRPDGGRMDFAFDLSRARIKASFRYGAFIRADIEPDFAGAEADLGDVFLQVAPTEFVDVRLGQAKAPFGELELLGRWRMPVQSRGIVSDVVADRLGFGRRKFGGRLRLRGRALPLRPELEVGVYGPEGDTLGEDVAARLALRLLKGLHVHAAFESVNGAKTDGGHGHAGSVSALYDRKGWFGLVEVLPGRARLLSAAGLATGVDATFLAVRAVGAVRFSVPHDLALEPYLSLELLEPNLSTRDDMSFAGRGGVNLLWLDRFRFGVELDRQTGQAGSVVPSRTTLAFFAGVALE